MVDTYTCTHCHGTYETAWSDDEALAEAEQWGVEADDLVVICDDCYQQFMAWWNTMTTALDAARAAGGDHGDT